MSTAISMILQKLLSAIAVVFGVALMVFFLIHLVPGDPVDVMLGESASITDRESIRQSLGLDKPLTVQLSDYFSGLLVLDFGHSLHTQQSVAAILSQRFPATLQLALAAMLIAILTSVPLGILSAIRKGSWIDQLARVFAMTGLSVPNFLLGPLLVMLFAIWLQLLPVSGNDSLQHLLLPAITLGLSMAAVLTRMVRSSLLETLGEDYIRTAWAKGVRPIDITWKHAMRNAWLPVITVIGAQMGALLGGAVVTEAVFDWPGIGSLMIESIQKRDYPLVQASVLVISISYVMVNTFTDVAYALLDPRIRRS